MIVKVFFPFEKSPYVKTVQTDIDINNLCRGDLVVINQDNREKTGVITYLKNIPEPDLIKAKLIRKADELDQYEFWSRLEDRLLANPVKITDSVYEEYKLTRDNGDISREQAERKLTRNLLLAHKPNRVYIENRIIRLQYGAMRLYYRHGMIHKLENKFQAPHDWTKDKFAYEYFGKLLRIEEGELVG